MKEVFKLIRKRIKEEIPAIAWIDYDYGQLETFHLRPELDFPCILIDFSLPNCEDVGTQGEQNCDLLIKLKVAVFTQSKTTPGASEEEVNRALQVLDLVNDVQEKFQWWHGSGLFGKLSRVSAKPDNRYKDIKAYDITYRTTMDDDRSAELKTVKAKAEPKVKVRFGTVREG